MNKRKDFSPEFKREAVRLLDAGQKPATDLARHSSQSALQMERGVGEARSGSLSRSGAALCGKRRSHSAA